MLKQRNLIKKNIILVLLLLCAVFCFFQKKTFCYAYTEEEKQAVKDWLTANGYPPTMSGAEQAYQDYLNGKFGPVGGDDTPVPPAETEMPQEYAEEEDTERQTESNHDVERKSETKEITETEVSQEETEAAQHTNDTKGQTAVPKETVNEKILPKDVVKILSETEDLTEKMIDTTQDLTDEPEDPEISPLAVILVTMGVCAGMIGGTCLYLKKYKVSQVQ